MFEAVSGHKRQLEILENAVKLEKIAHAFTFAGPAGVGKKFIAKKLAQQILAAPLPNPPHKGEGTDSYFFHPDYLEISEEGEIKIETIRDLIYKLSLKPYQAKYKVAVIDKAENLNASSSNALLKSLEEAKPNTIIILITSNPNRLPKTILSRTQKINFGAVDQIQKIPNEAELKASEFYKVFQKEDLAMRLISAYDLAELETQEIKDVFGVWLEFMEKELLQNASKKLAKKITQVLQARKFLDQNVNSKLLLTNLMLNT